MPNLPEKLKKFSHFFLFLFFPTLNKKKLAALFTEEERDGPSELAFKYAIFRINKDRTLLENTTLTYDIQYVPREDSFHASKKGLVWLFEFFQMINFDIFVFEKKTQIACLQMNRGVSAIFGPQDPILGAHIQSLCDALDMPHIEARLDLETELKEFSINLYPSPMIIGKALRDLIVYLNWTKIAVIYEDDICKCMCMYVVVVLMNKFLFYFI